MSTATTMKQARREFLADVQRLAPTPEGYQAAIRESLQLFADKANKLIQRELRAKEDFLKKNEVAFKAFLATQTDDEE